MRQQRRNVLKSTPGSLLHAKEVEEGAAPLKREENLARGVEERKSTSGSLLHTREVEDAETVAERNSGQPPACPCMRGMSAGRVRGRCVS